MTEVAYRALCRNMPGNETLSRLFEPDERRWCAGLTASDLTADKKRAVIHLLKALVVALLRTKPASPLSFLVSAAAQQVTVDWQVPDNYNYVLDTATAYKVGTTDVYGTYQDIRARLDFGYHGNYTRERQILQDVLVTDVVSAGTRKEHPWLVFTAGAMGAGKSHCIRWMSDNGYFPLPDLVQIDPDRFKELLPEWDGYLEVDPHSAGAKTRKESGFCVEIAQEEGLRRGKNVWVDGSLRDEEWYSKEFDRINRDFPQYRIAIIHVRASLALVKQRALERGMQTGRFVPEEEIEDSFKKVPKVVESLAKKATFVADIVNEDREPQLAGYKRNNVCEVNHTGSWKEISDRFATLPELNGGTDWDDRLSTLLAESRVLLFTKTYCSHTHRIEEILKVLCPGGYQRVLLDKMEGGVGIQVALSRRTGIRTVPVLVAHGRVLGTGSSVLKLHKKGLLAHILEDPDATVSPDNSLSPASSATSSPTAGPQRMMQFP
ncbi:Glutaredoxin-C4 [Diplonema papillatum]|nr:Glutaredoxin-C4 [Diplonema papillatum]